LQEQHAEEQNKLEELRRNNAVLLEKISALQSGNQSLQQQSAEEQKRLEELSRNNAVLLEKLSALQNNNQSLLAQSSEAQKKMEELRRNNAVLQEKLLTIHRNHQSLQEQYDEKVNHNEVLFKKIESLLIEVQVLEEKNEGAEIEIVKMNDSLDESREVKSELEAQIQELAQKLNAISKTNEQLKGQLSAVSSRYQHVADTEVPTLKQQVGTLHEKNIQLEQELKAIDDKRIAAEKRVHELRSSLTFKTGYLIRNQSRSMLGVLKIPGGLWRIYQQDRVRARQRMPKQPPQKISFEKRATPFQEVQSPDVAADNLSSVVPPRRLPMACFMDDFTSTSYQPECELQQLTPNHWESELEAFKPEVLFIESAWRGKDELWGSKVGHKSKEVQGIVAWCKAHAVPTLFWNKEDPVHFETFLSTAKLFDCVFTTDIDCIHRYKAA